MPRKPRTKMTAYRKDEDRERSRPYTSSSDLEVILHGLPPLVPQRLDASVAYPDKPTYEVETASGDVEKYEHDKDSLETPEDEEAWQQYLDDMAEAETELTEKLLYAILVESVELKDYKDHFDRWKKKQKFMKLELSEDEDENKFHFMQIEVFRDADDIGEILTIVMGLTGVSVEDLADSRDSFPGEVEPEPSDGSGDTSRTAEDSAE